MTQTKGKRVGNWEIIRLIGKGGNGIVSRVKQTSTAYDGAMKRLLDDSNQANQGDFEREIRNAARITTANPSAPPSLPRLLDNGVFENIGTKEERRVDKLNYFYVMDYVGDNAIDVETRQGRLALWRKSLDTQLNILGAIADALSFLYGNEIEHNDVKPLNIVTKGITASLVDYGSVRDTKALTDANPGQTPQYAPPGKKSEFVFGYSDLYAFAITVYEILSVGDYPFGDRSDNGEAWRDLKSGFQKNEPTWTKRPSKAMRRWVRREDRQEFDKLFANVFDYHLYTKAEEAASRPYSSAEDFWKQVRPLLQDQPLQLRWIVAGVAVIAAAFILFTFTPIRNPCFIPNADCPLSTGTPTPTDTSTMTPTATDTSTELPTTIITVSPVPSATVATQTSPEDFVQTLVAMSSTPLATATPTLLGTNTPSASSTLTVTIPPTATLFLPSATSTSTVTSLPPTDLPASATLPPTSTAVQPTVTTTDTHVVSASLTPGTVVPRELVRNGDYRMCYEQMPNLCNLPTFRLTTYRNAARVRDAVVGVSWRSAQNYCLLAGGSLPIAEEILNLMQSISAPSFREWILPPDASRELFASLDAVEAFEGQATAISANGEIAYSLITNSTEDTVFRCIPNVP